MVEAAVKGHQVSIRLACVCLCISETYKRYEAKLDVENPRIVDLQLELTEANRKWGVCYRYLPNLKRFTWNHKRFYRFRELELNRRIKPKKWIVRERREPLSVLTAINQVWSIDFMIAALVDDRKLRTFNLLDDYNREGLGIEVGLSFLSARMIQSLEQIIELRGKLAAIRCDDGSELVSETLIQWTKERQITIVYIQNGKLNQNADVER